MKNVSKSRLEWIFLFSFTIAFIILLILPQDKFSADKMDTKKIASTIENSKVINNCLDLAANPNEIELFGNENY